MPRSAMVESAKSKCFLETPVRAIGFDEFFGALTLISTMNFLAGIYASQGRSIEAQTLHAKVLEVRLRVLGKDHPEMQDTIQKLEALRHRPLRENAKLTAVSTR